MTWRVRAVVRLGGQLLRAGFRTGRWWVPLAALVLLLALVLAQTATVVVPTATYVLF